ncbi:hypothetical protein PtrSN002B_003565 [Pyrenophora tritici-repentis]|uniref:Herpes-BLLF1 multi-domain protein n=2 Tax=Pyrenophora tritici-repentis TaxID=45151 RepID=A0A2W1HN04_9PLEO|nr:uncharacterized protein PTRG_10111 [Pyrenophora tritici-repentis Pt-1C-BFP]KAA8621467.1 hypothetical protein PtrV1_05968 [Pyrenophora tritici-repentis]EDU43162.1 hypothetical protein PTRG_10111 [Pyrenophora tritici-repentis Pt-1C-BFP]KAF7450708.1 hypothetical protein A1F99_053240 [Pyrenophora tritici-repentis]KAF7573348.1 Herpes-BLLF1 multi-domain protein [Pyrenophora tritici-repentis]KAG9381072.1 hypothetical protein A1F94_008392 [Pyrenophora tritici-repentis]
MKSFATALLIGAAAAANITVTNYHYVGVNGYPSLGFFLSADSVECSADHYVPGVAYKCNDPAWSFVIDADAPAEGNSFTLTHTVTCKTASAHFHIPLNGPIPTVLGQIGLGVTEELVVDEEQHGC